jgi:hypothetical protein
VIACDKCEAFAQGNENDEAIVIPGLMLRIAPE